MSLITDELVRAVRTATPCCRNASVKRAENVLSSYRFCRMAVRAVPRVFVCIACPGRSGRPARIPGTVTKGVSSSFGSLTGQSSLAMVMATVAFGHVGVVNGAVVPVVGVPLGQDAVGVVAVDVRSRAPTTPMADAQAVEAEPLCRHIGTHHVAWTTPSDDNCRRAVDGT
jgi:hypothetical protein